MKCLTPITIKNPRGFIPGAFQYMEVPCKKCSVCLKRRAMQWMFRLQQENKEATTAAFMTYTYENEQLPFTANGLPTLEQSHHTKFMKRLRKRIHKTDPFNLPLKYYAVGEYGGETERPHYHAILFNLPKSYIDRSEKIQEIWSHGIISCDQVTDASIAYVCGYVNKQKFFTTNNPWDDRKKEFSVMSKGLGKRFLSPQRVKRMKDQLDPTIRVEDGRIIAIPDYYRKKVYNDEEMRIIAEKCIKHHEENHAFIDEKHHVDYVKQDARNRRRKSKERRKI